MWSDCYTRYLFKAITSILFQARCVKKKFCIVTHGIANNLWVELNFRMLLYCPRYVCLTTPTPLPRFPQKAFGILAIDAVEKFSINVVYLMIRWLESFFFIPWPSRAEKNTIIKWHKLFARSFRCQQPAKTSRKLSDWYSTFYTNFWLGFFL